jgi:hypothetical protein
MPMKIMVAGSRTWGQCPHDSNAHWVDRLPGGCMVVARHRKIMTQALVEHVMPHFGEFLTLMHGDCEGADQLAASIWDGLKLGPVQAFPARWSDLGGRAGHVRNGIMVAHMPDLVLAFHLGNSRGTADAIRQARAAGLRTEVYGEDGRRA